jgi:hypothetical protein
VTELDTSKSQALGALQRKHKKDRRKERLAEIERQKKLKPSDPNYLKVRKAKPGELPAPKNLNPKETRARLYGSYT